MKYRKILKGSVSFERKKLFTDNPRDRENCLKSFRGLTLELGHETYHQTVVVCREELKL